MKSVLGTICIAVTCLTGSLAIAGERTVTLQVANLFCASCPFIVKRTLARIDGVKKVDVSMRTKTATVTFDDQSCSAAQLASAVTEAGFPSTPVKE